MEPIQMFYLGIDPGKAGGIAVLDDGGHVVMAKAMPPTERDVYELLAQHITSGHDIRAMVEHVHASPQMGVVSAFTFGKGYGALLMALTCAHIRFDEVSPMKWQRALQCQTKGDKNVSKRRAQQLWPRLTITHALADALLIAEFCRRFHNARPLERKDQHGSQVRKEGRRKETGREEVREGTRQEGGREESAEAERASRRRRIAEAYGS